MSINEKKPKNEHKLSTEAYKGVRDFFPEDMAVEKAIFAIWREVAEKYGYEEYAASVLEPAELYRAKSGEEIVNEQTYTFTDRGNREVTLRPEMTPTVARMVAGRRRELVFPLRWYSIPNLFRYEQPQRGRLREHWQLNADIFGAADIEADIEIISLAYHIMKAFGAKDSDFEIRIGSRVWLDTWFEWLALDFKKFSFEKTSENKEKLFKLLDLRVKNPAKYAAGLTELNPDFTPELIEAKYVEFKTADKNLALGAVELFDRLKKLGITNVVFDPTNVVRGFDYYTGNVFEIFDTDPKNRRSIFGGGRYDNLTELFGGDPIPAVGFGMGDVTIRDFLETHGLLENLTSAYPADYSLLTMSGTESDAENEFAMELAERLREKGSRISIDFSNKKIGDKIKNADKRKIPAIIVIGENEVKTGTYKIKNLKTGEEAEE
jgi:histidyl-tRNA synthetase